MKTSKVFRLVSTLFALHLAVSAGLVLIRESSPSQELKVTSTSGALILFGKDWMGFSRIKLFNNWEELQSYVDDKNLSFPAVSEAYINLPKFVDMAPLSESENTEVYKIRWSHDGINYNALLTPDRRSAEELRLFVAYYGLQSSHYGFSIPLKN